jgi:D-alanine-D-alanine ligase-like ATP-grasp enzyme
VQAGEISRAIAELQKAKGEVGSAGYVAAYLGYAYATSGDRSKAMAMIEEFARGVLAKIRFATLASDYLSRSRRSAAEPGRIAESL